MERLDFLSCYRFEPSAEELISHYLKNKILSPLQETGLPNGFEFRDISGIARRKVMSGWTPVYSSNMPEEVVIGHYRMVRLRAADPETWYEYKIDPIGHPEVQGFGWEDWVILREHRRP